MLLDCGASRHMLADKTVFTSLTPLADYSIQLGSSTSTKRAQGQELLNSPSSSVMGFRIKSLSVTHSRCQMRTPTSYSLRATIAKGSKPFFSTSNGLSVHLADREALHATIQDSLWIVKTVMSPVPEASAHFSKQQNTGKQSYQL